VDVAVLMTNTVPVSAIQFKFRNIATCKPVPILFAGGGAAEANNFIVSKDPTGLIGVVSGFSLFGDTIPELSEELLVLVSFPISVLPNVVIDDILFGSGTSSLDVQVKLAGNWPDGADGACSGV